MEYQIIYITSGSGFFESENSGRYHIGPGMIMLLFPDVLHRYSPDQKTGWTEYYIGVNGSYMDSLVKEGFLSMEKPVFEIGVHEKLVQRYNEIFQLAENQMIGYQQYAAGTALHLLGEILFLERNNIIDSSTEQLMQSIKIYITEKISKKIDWNEVSLLHGVSYSKLRKMFKAYVGISPAQYQLQLRINEAKLMLSQTIEPIKQIATSLGFQNEYYFNTIFKRKTGTAPGAYRNSSRGINLSDMG